MPFSKWLPLSRLISLPTRTVPAKWIRLSCLVIFFAVILTSLPAHLKHDGASAESHRPRRTQGLASGNLPDFGETSGNAASIDTGKKYSPGGWTPGAALIGNDAAFISQSVPGTMTAGKTYTVIVRMRNQGATTWTAANHYSLGSQNPVNNGTWGLGRVYLEAGETVPPGGSKTFMFTVTAPAIPGSYALFQWRMVHELVEWFGDNSSGVVVALSPGNLNMALIDPINRIGSPGEDLLSRNYNWSLPLLSLPGRAGLDLGLALSLNSLIYTRAGSVIHFDPEQGYPAPGFSLGFPEIRNAFINTEANTQSYLLSMPSGRRVEFRQINTNVYEAVDSSYMRLTHDPINSVFVLYTTDGTQCRFVDVTGSGDYKCVQIKDRNGNYITISYGSLAEIRTITDTLGRVINFNYDGFNHLNSITQNWGVQTHTWATFAYGTQTIQTNFPGMTLNGTTNGAQESVLTRVGLADGSIYSFVYNTYAQVKTIVRYTPNNSNPVNFPGDYRYLAYTIYGLPDNANDPQTDCPRITSRTDWAAGWTQVTSYYAPDSSFASGQVTFPDGTRYKEFFAITGWQRGLTMQTENWSGDVRMKWTELQWTQDNTGVVYKLNPRVTETNVYDEVGNRRRATVSYTSFGLPSEVYEYDADTTTVLRRTHTDYNLSAVYTDRRIIGLPSAKYLYDGANNLFSKVDYQYDLGGGYQVHQGPPARHDTANYGASFVQGRGNLNKMRRWDVTAPNNASLASEYETGYNTSGSVIFTRDPLNHQTSVSYADSFSDGQNNRNTYAYPTTMTDPDTFSSSVRYNYDFGAVTWTQDPKGAAVTRTYDAAGRIERVRNEVNGAYTRYIYGPDQSYVQSFATINDLNPANEFYSITVFDGHNRVMSTHSYHPTSVGQYKAQLYVYDVMGRQVGQTNPTEINGYNQPAGDDMEGWAWSYQDYDWQGRPTFTTNQDGTTKEIIYGGCGCAGGQVVVTRDEVGRRQKMTYDILGRLKTTQALFIQPKNQPLNGDGDVYSTQINTYNVRDQITQVSRVAQSGGASQITTVQYDGHGRLWKRRTPIESGDTIYEYYGDDTVFRVTDARGTSSAFSFNNRRLVTGITYSAPSGVDPTPNATFGYDEAGNRTSMTDGLGSATYHYDALSRMDWETRVLTGVGSFTINYAYNLSGELTSVTDPANDSITYVYNRAGEMTAVNGSDYGSEVGYSHVVRQYASGLKFRAWGGLNTLSYGNGLSLANSYTARMQLQQLEVKGQASSGSPSLMKTQYQYHPDGNPKFAQNHIDSRFDRAWAYDHVMRLSEAYTGQEADNYAGVSVPAPQTGPYRQTHQYDAWNNLTSRTGRYWSKTTEFTMTYNSQNQRQGWMYDAAGNLLTDEANLYTYDAAGRNIAAGAMSQEFDGLGRAIKRIDHDGYLMYYLYSTPLGGRVLTELWGANVLGVPVGTKASGYVYAGRSLLAKQRSNVSFNWVDWEHHDVLTGTRARSTNITIGNGGFGGTGRREPDPMGADVGLSEPVDPPAFQAGEVQYQEVDESEEVYPDGRCTLNGMSIGCSMASSLLSSGAAVVAPQQTTVPLYSKESGKFVGWGFYNPGAGGYEYNQLYLQQTLSANGQVIGRWWETIKEDGVVHTETIGAISGEFIGGGGLSQSKKAVQPQPSKGPQPADPTCTVTLGSRGLNYLGLQRVVHHMFITTQTSSQSIPTVFQGTHPDLYLRVQEAEFKDPNEDYRHSRNPGAIFVHVDVPGTCDEVNASFRATKDEINAANILYEIPAGTRLAPGITTPGPPRNSNAVAYTLLQRWSPEWRVKLEGKYREESGRPFSLFTPGWNKLLVK